MSRILCLLTLHAWLYTQRSYVLPGLIRRKCQTCGRKQVAMCADGEVQGGWVQL